MRLVAAKCITFLSISFLFVYQSDAYISIRPSGHKVKRIQLSEDYATKHCAYKSIPVAATYRHIDSLAKTVAKSVCILSFLTPLTIDSAFGVASNSDDSINAYTVKYEDRKVAMKDLLGYKATLIVNVASQCALTPQYEELVDLYNKYDSRGFQLLAFPCNQFGNQEPADVIQVRKDMATRFGVKFPILDKIDVNGGNEDPLYSKLKSYKDIGVSKIGKISWNFEKFLVNADGVPVRRYKPGVLPSELAGDVDTLISTGKLSPRKKASLNNY